MIGYIIYIQAVRPCTVLSLFKVGRFYTRSASPKAAMRSALAVVRADWDEVW
jgi:hypothetical protein